MHAVLSKKDDRARSRPVGYRQRVFVIQSPQEGLASVEA